MGTETRIIKDKSKVNKIINIRPNNLKAKLLYYLPEDFYYDRNQYKDPEICMNCLQFKKCFECPHDNFLGQELAFDIDPENIPCSCKSTYPNFCDRCMKEAIHNAILLGDYLKQYFHLIRFVYSGRGCHVHVLDKSAFKLSIDEREALNKELQQFNIDPWVSRGHIRLIRAPYSLNALVSRVVMPLSTKEITTFNPLTNNKTIPLFMRQEV